MSSNEIEDQVDGSTGLRDEWVAAGLITREQADRIGDYESARHDRLSGVPSTPEVPGGAPSMVVEALGYLGGVIMLVGAGILVGLYWLDIPVALRLTLMAVTALALVGAGLAVPDRLGEAAGRLHAVLWALAVAATGGFFAVLSIDVLHRYDEDALIVIGPATALVAAALWWQRRTSLQQLALLAPLLLSAAAVGLQIGDADSAPGIAVWALGVAWTAVAWTGRLQPRITGVAFGGLVAIFGASTTSAAQLGIALGLATAVAMLVLSMLERSLPWLAVTAFGLLWTAPRAVVEWFPGRLSASLTLIVTGGLLVGAAIWVARHQGTRVKR